MTNLEVIASSLEDAIAAEKGGAHSVEVCVDLANGGITAPLDVVKAIRDAVNIDMNVMLRPHSETFVYSEADIDLILEQVAVFKTLGIQTAVFGAHTKDGKLDIDLIRQISEAAHPLPLTVHRALEWSSNPDESLPQLIGIAQRILTSGNAPSAPEGQESLKIWVEQYGEQLRFAAAGGIRLHNIREIADSTKAHECHVGTAAQINGEVSVEKVRELYKALGQQKTF